MRRADEEREARIVSTPPTQLPRETGWGGKCSKPMCRRPALGSTGMCLAHLGGATKAGRHSKAPAGRCDCGQPATALDSGHRPICQACADTWTRYINAEKLVGRAVKALAAGPVTVQAVAERLGIGEGHAGTVVSRLVKAGRARRTGSTLPLEYELVPR